MVEIPLKEGQVRKEPCHFVEVKLSNALNDAIYFKHDNYVDRHNS